MSKVKLALAELTISEKTQLSAAIIGAMTGNPNYTTPNPPLTTVQAAATLLTRDAAPSEKPQPPKTPAGQPRRGFV